MNRILAFLYGLFAYAGFLLVFLYLVVFLADVVVPRTVDRGAAAPWWAALPIDLALLGLFGVQHSLMARPTFKRWWTRIVPGSIERSTYVLLTNLVLVLVYWQWRPLDAVVWDLQDWGARALAWSVFASGWLLVLVATLQINHLDLFGVRHVWLHLRGRSYEAVGFKLPFLYRRLRHPIYLGWMTAFWATPTMTAGHLLFAAGMTAYMLIAIRLEERNLVEWHGAAYADYRRRVPMLLPRLRPLPQPAAVEQSP